MKQLILSLAIACLSFSCAVDGPGLPPPEWKYLLLNPDSSSIITSPEDKVDVTYRDPQNSSLRRSYTVFIGTYGLEASVPWAVDGSVYVLYLGRTEGDSIFIDCKGKMDTLVKRSDPVKLFFNGKEIPAPSDEDAVIPLVRQWQVVDPDTAPPLHGNGHPVR